MRTKVAVVSDQDAEQVAQSDLVARHRVLEPTNIKQDKNVIQFRNLRRTPLGNSSATSQVRKLYTQLVVYTHKTAAKSPT